MIQSQRIRDGQDRPAGIPGRQVYSEKQTIEGEINSWPKRTPGVAQQTIDYSKMLFSKGYVTKLQLEADEFALEKAKMAQKTAETKLHVLENFTKPKMLTQLESDIKTTGGKYKSDQHSHQLDIESSS